MLQSARFWLAVVFAPLVLPILILLFIKLRGGFDSGIHGLWHFFYFTLYRDWPVLIMLYAGQLFLLVPLCLLLHYKHILRLAFYLPGTYIVGGLTNSIGYPLIDPAYITPASLTGALILLFISGGTYGFFHGYLFWYLAGLNRLREDEQHAHRY